MVCERPPRLRLSEVASRHFIDGAATPPVPGGEHACPGVHSHPAVPNFQLQSPGLVGIPGRKFIGELFDDSFRQRIGHLEDMVIHRVEGPGVFLPVTLPYQTKPDAGIS